jgi:hypothetical protein
MNENQQAAYIISQAACLMAEIMGMQAENMQREHRGESMAFIYADFEETMIKSGVCHNQVMEYFKGR